MNITIDSIMKAREIARADEKLAKALKQWFHHKGQLSPNERYLSFSEWVYGMCEYMAGCIGEDETVEHLVEALRVNAIGVPLAGNLSLVANVDGFVTDTNCYVEDNIVYAGVWISNKTAEENKKRADEMAEVFRKNGYAVDVWVDEVDDTEVTVNAQIDFPVYLKNLGK